MDAHKVTGFSIKIAQGRSGLALDVNQKYPCWIYFSSTDPENALMNQLVTKLTFWSKEVVGYNLILALRVFGVALIFAGTITLILKTYLLRDYSHNLMLALYFFYGIAVTAIPFRWFEIGKGKALMPIVLWLPRFLGVTLPLFILSPWIDSIRKWLEG